MDNLQLFLNSPYEHHLTNSIYSVFSTITIDSDINILNQVLPKLFQCFDEGLLRRNLVYLNLLANPNRGLLQLFIDHEIKQPLSLHNGMSLFVYCYYQKRHWFRELLTSNSSLANVLESGLQNDLKIFELVQECNRSVISLGIVNDLLIVIDTKQLNDPFIIEYVNEAKYILEIIEYCQKCKRSTQTEKQNLFTTINETQLFLAVNNNKLLRLFSEHLNLNDDQQWPEILQKLQREEERFDCNLESDTSSRDVDEFSCFVILGNILKSLRECVTTEREISKFINNAKDALEALTQVNPKLTLQILEDIFSMCFLKWKDLAKDQNFDKVEKIGKPEFVCADKELRLLLYFLRPCIDDLSPKIPLRSTEAVVLQELNKHVMEAMWRLEMLDDMVSFDMSHMLSDSETLIQTSLKKGRFDKAHQVIQIFNLEETELAQEIIYTEKLQALRTTLHQTFKLQQLQNSYEKIPKNTSKKHPKKILDEFLEKSNHQTHDFIDVAFITALSFEDTPTVLDCLQIAPDFHEKVTVLLNSIQSTNLREILTNPLYNLNLDVYRGKLQYCHEVKHTLEAFYKHLKINSENNADNNGHLIYKNYSELKQLAGIKDHRESPGNYFHRLFNYLKIFLRIFSTEGNNVDLITRNNSNGNGTVVYFDILQKSRSEWIGTLLFQRNMDPRDFEHIFSKMKIDLLYTTATNCFPFIALNSNTSEQIVKEHTYREPTCLVFSYITKRNWLLAFILNELFNLVQMDVNETRTKYFTQLVNTSEIEHLKILFNNNKIVTALQRREVVYQRAVNYISKHLAKEQELIDSKESDEEIESAEEISEGRLHSKWMSLLLMIESLPENYSMSTEITGLKDKMLINLITDSYDEESYKYVRYISNDHLRKQVILENFMSWPGDFCVDLLKLESDQELINWSQKIQFYEEVRPLFDQSWFNVHELCTNYPDEVYSQLLTVPKVLFLINFDKYYLTGDLLRHTPTQYISALFNSSEHLSHIEELLLKLKNPIEACFELLETIRNLNQLEFLISMINGLRNFQSGDDEDESLNYLKNVSISSKILRNFSPPEREQLWCLVGNPLALIEMLIMNTKLDKLGIILEDIRDDLENCEFADHVISLESIDELLRKYAEKSLEFRIILEPHPSLLKGSDAKLMESLDSIYGPDRKYFEMPKAVPSKAEWTPNDQVLECMCCQNTVFSMFNRRHHCRRCGRVICFNCSTKRMLVPTYDDIMVRVCLDCYDQSRTDTRSDSTSCKSIVYDHWCLSEKDEHNTIVRQEFSYEHAPSVSLCLSIMKYHTKSHSYPKFLLDQCDVMLKLLQPPAQNAPQEVDYMLVIKMLKSLAIAAKMISAECQLPWGSSQADRILSQADLFALLAERGCLTLLPPSSSGAPYVDAIILRKLRDKLLMQEQWYFALDVSTKAGLETAGVFAAWGKSCLKVGCLQMAREKFQRCFDKPGYYDSLSTSLNSSVPSLENKDKPAKNPAILEQIIEILESKTLSFTTPINNTTPLRKGDNNKNAILIKSKLRNLKTIANGNLEPRAEFKGCNIDPVYFEECLYYLKKYGSHLGLLQFYLKHCCITESLIYMYDNKVTVDVFVEVYVICLRDGKISQLQKAMSRIDSTLEVWKHYLQGICRHLEKQHLLNSLYQLQQYMVDYVRAAMTCIRFYKDSATSYKELLANIHFLDKAEAHLLQEVEQQQWVEVNTVAKSMSDSSYEEKPALSNPSLVMKMDSRTIDQHIYTIKKQSQITKFLAQQEKSDVQMLQLLPYIMPNIEGESASRAVAPKQLPTLFDSNNEKIQLAVLLIICGERIQDGYDLAHGVIQDYKLKSLKVYCHAGRQLARLDRYNEIAELVNCIRAKGTNNDPAVTNICDEMLTLAVRTLSRNDVPPSQLETLIKLITDRATKISIYIETRQLKSAYLLAAKYNRFGDIRRILREAELINKQDIKKLCQRLLQFHSHSKD